MITTYNLILALISLVFWSIMINVATSYVNAIDLFHLIILVFLFVYSVNKKLDYEQKKLKFLKNKPIRI